MNYYKRHLGDYARKTAHLSLLEHGVYNVLLDAYYDRERSLSETEAIRFSRARTDEEIQAVKNVLAEFFFEENGQFSQRHADEVIADFHKRQKTNRKLGAIGGKRNAKRIASENEANDEAKLKPSHKPLASNQKKEKAEASLALPLWLPEKQWTDFVANRKAIKKPMTPRAQELILAKLADIHRRGLSVTASIETSIRNGWQDVFDPKPAPNQTTSSDDYRSPASMRRLT